MTIKASLATAAAAAEAAAVAAHGPGLAWVLPEHSKWDFPKVRGTLFWGPYNKDPTSLSTILGSPIFGNPQID